MQRIDYDKLAADLTAMWKASPNLDNDPVTAGQIRAADVSGKLAAFMVSEIDRVAHSEDREDHKFPMLILAAIVATEAFNLCRASSKPEMAANVFMDALGGYLSSMLSAPKDAKPGDAFNGIVFGGAIDAKVDEVPN